MTTSATPHLFWITSRAAGIVALVLASLAVSLGLLMSTKLLRKRGPDLLAVHEVLSISTIVAIVVHGLALLGDSYLHPSMADIAIPFAGSYKTGWTSLGIIAGWGTALLGLSYYARRWIGAKRWRSLHRLTAVVWLAGLVHAVGRARTPARSGFWRCSRSWPRPRWRCSPRAWPGARRRRRRQRARAATTPRSGPDRPRSPPPGCVPLDAPLPGSCRSSLRPGPCPGRPGAPQAAPRPGLQPRRVANHES